MKRARLVKLLQKDAKGKFDLNGAKEVIREDIAVTDEWIAETNAGTDESGMYYEVIGEHGKPKKEEKKTTK